MPETKTRLEANQQIIKELSAFLEKYPEQRFSQALVNLDIVQRTTDSQDDSEPVWVDEYYVEPWDILRRIWAAKAQHGF